MEQLPKTVVARGARNVGEVICSVDNQEAQLLPNTNVNVRIQTAESENSLVIPRAAARAEGNKRYIFVVEGGWLRKKEIQVGISNANTYEVLDGITENDLIALPENFELQDGMPVTIGGQK